MFVSCKQSIFLKRKYTDGFFFSKTGAPHLKEIHQAQSKNIVPAFSEQADVVIVRPEPLTDTIILNSGRKVPCKVKTIERKKITYTDGISGPAGSNKIMMSKKVARIHFKEGQKEYFTQHDPKGNPILQFDFIRTGKPPRSGLAFLGYILIMLTSFGLVVASIFIGLLFLALSLVALVWLSSSNYETVGFKIVRGFGKFIGILFIAAVAALLLIILIALAAFA